MSTQALIWPPLPQTAERTKLANLNTQLARAEDKLSVAKLEKQRLTQSLDPKPLSFKKSDQHAYKLNSLQQREAINSRLKELDMQISNLTSSIESLTNQIYKIYQTKTKTE
jgi:ribosomal protein L9